MIFGKYGQMILENMKRKYPERTQELIFKNELNLKIFQREQYVLEKKELVENAIREYYPPPLTNEMQVMAKYQELVDAMVEENLIGEIIKSI